MPRFPFPEILDSTCLASAKGCEQQFYLSWIRNLQLRDTTAIDLIAGGAFARGVQAVREAFYRDHLSIDDAIASGIRPMTLAYGDPIVPEHKKHKSWFAVLRALVWFFDEYPLDNTEFVPILLGDQLTVEFTFAIPLPISHPETGNPLLYAGRCDMIAKYQGALWNDDEKTCSQLGATWGSKWGLRSQFLGYHWAAREANIDTVGTIVHGISFLKDRNEFAEALVVYEPYMIDRWYENMLAEVKHIIDCWKNDSYRYDFAETCIAYGGCPFQFLCKRADKEPWIEARYEKKPAWNPLFKES